MKKLKLLAPIIALLLMSFTDAYDSISNLIQSGNAKALAQYIATNIDLAIDSHEAVYSKAQAEQILHTFFTANVPKAFNLLHKGSSKEGTMYAIGTLTTQAGKTFRTSFYFKTVEGKEQLKELRFEPE